MKKVKMEPIRQEEFYNYLDFIENHYAVTFGKDARNTLYGYCADTKHGGLGTCIEIMKTSFSKLRPEWISISVHLAYGDETREYFPEHFRLREPGDDLTCYSPDAIYINEDQIGHLKTVDISASFLRSVSRYHIVV